MISMRFYEYIGLCYPICVGDSSNSAWEMHISGPLSPITANVRGKRGVSCFFFSFPTITRGKLNSRGVPFLFSIPCHFDERAQPWNVPSAAKGQYLARQTPQTTRSTDGGQTKEERPVFSLQDDSQ